jgi:L-asparaginase
MRIKLITTGGTIATVTDLASGSTHAELDGPQVAQLASETVGADIEVEPLALSPSWGLSVTEMMRVATVARDAARSGRFTGIVVTHGTSTIEYTAFLAELVNDTDVPIVFTGAMRLATDAQPDGPHNLSDAFRVALDRSSRGYRALVVFAGLVINARNAWKLKRDLVDAFISVNVPSGLVAGGDLTMPPKPGPHPVFNVGLEQRVSLVKIYPGLTTDEFAVATASGRRGTVVEAFAGAGGVPYLLHSALESAAGRMPVVISSRAPVGRVGTPPTGGTGEPLAHMNLISANDLTSEKAWLLLMSALGQSENAIEARALFEAYAFAG